MDERKVENNDASREVDAHTKKYKSFLIRVVQKHALVHSYCYYRQRKAGTLQICRTVRKNTRFLLKAQFISNILTFV